MGSPVTVARVITVLSALVALLIDSGLFKSISLNINGLLARFTSTAAAGGSRGQGGSQAAAGEGSPGLALPRGTPGDRGQSGTELDERCRKLNLKVNARTLQMNSD